MEQQGTVNNRTFVRLNFRFIILAPTIYIYNIYIHIYIYIYIYIYAQRLGSAQGLQRMYVPFMNK